MNRRDRTSALVDGVLNLMVTGSAITAGVLLPGLIIGLEKPLKIFWKNMDERARERELRRTITYMKSRNLIRGNYEHGLQITNKGRKRFEKIELEQIRVQKQKYWDKKWRIIFFDIPEDKKSGRDALIQKLKQLEFYQLQRSVWIYPYPCRDAIAKIASFYRIDTFVTYIETIHIDNEKKLKEKFKNLLS